jgi:mono/diheme cytochrome c family protein
MKIVVWLFAAGLVLGQDLAGVLKQGQAIYAKSCSSGYCHGAAGAGAGAPRLAGRGFDQAFINSVVTRGVTGTAMPAFNPGLAAPDRAAVVAYIASLNGIANPAIPRGAPPIAARALSPEQARGKALFSDATRGFARCSTCHEVNGIGIPVAAPFTKLPANAAALKDLVTPGGSTAILAGESMPVLIVSRKAQSVIFYDLTSVPPVLRTVAPAEIQIREGSSWRHGPQMGSYTSAEELNAILMYLRTAL